MNRVAALALVGLLWAGQHATAQAPATEAELLTKIKAIETVQPSPTPAEPAAPVKAGNVTEITATKEASFDNAKHVAVFIGDVRVKDPQFLLTCQKLTAYLKKASISENGNARPAASPKPAASPAPNGGGLEKAIAEGNVVIVQEKPSEDGKKTTRYVGRADRAEYDAVGGEMRLIGSPQVQEGINLHLGTDPSTVMIMHRDGRTMRTEGPSRTLISDKPVDNPAPRP